jgi:hypothetical protein
MRADGRIADSFRPQVEQLHLRGFRVLMCTGDAPNTAHAAPQPYAIYGTCGFHGGSLKWGVQKGRKLCHTKMV